LRIIALRIADCGLRIRIAQLAAGGGKNVIEEDIAETRSVVSFGIFAGQWADDGNFLLSLPFNIH
jgi:hypothetical protein